MKCKISSYSCVYHACMSDDCQKKTVLTNYPECLRDWGVGECEKNMEWINNKILNKSGLAAELWNEDDAGRNTLRKRLDQKVAANTLTAEEKRKIVLIFEEFTKLIKGELLGNPKWCNTNYVCTSQTCKQETTDCFYDSRNKNKKELNIKYVKSGNSSEPVKYVAELTFVKERKYKIITNDSEACSSLIAFINLDEKTNYIDSDYFELDAPIVKHIVTTKHNIRNFKRKYCEYEIETC